MKIFKYDEIFISKLFNEEVGRAILCVEEL